MKLYLLTLASLLVTLNCLSQTLGSTNGSVNSNCSAIAIEKSLKAMGGKELLSSVNSIHYTSNGYRNLVEQSERPEGPFLPDVRTVTYDINFPTRRLQYEAQGKLFGSKAILVANDEAAAYKFGKRYFPWQAGQLVMDDFDLSPSRILFTAMNSNDKVCLKDTLLQSSPTTVLRFTHKGFPVKVYINKYTSLITAVEVIKPYNESFLAIWGDTKKMAYYSNWQLMESGLHYPLQSDTYVNDWHYSSDVISDLSFEQLVNPDSLLLPVPIKEASAKYHVSNLEQTKMGMEKGKKEIVKDIWFLPGPCNTTIVKQADGIVVIESALDTNFSTIILFEVGKLYPGEKIKAVVTTSDAWLHFGGLREYAAKGTKIICLDLNKKIIDKLLNAPYKSNPDAWQLKKDKRITIETISKKTVIGDGSNQMEIYPFRTEAGERMMMVYFPKHKLLYASDLFQPKGPDGKYWNLHYIGEVYEAIMRENLEVEKLYAMHSYIVPFEEIKKDLRK